MNFVWADVKGKKNVRLFFELFLDNSCDELRLCAADYYRVVLDGKFVCFGPSRTAAGFTRCKKININGVKKITVEVEGYNVTCYSCDFQQPFFGAEVLRNGEIVHSTDDFWCYKDKTVIENAMRYTTQRGFIEEFDFHNAQKEVIDTYSVSAPTVIYDDYDPCDYKSVEFAFLGKSPFNGFVRYEIPSFLKREDQQPKEGEFELQKDFLEEIKAGYTAYDFSLERERTGFLRLDITASSDVKIFAIFEEIKPDGEWIYGRSGCNDFLIVKAPEGKRSVLSFEPYAFKFLKIIVKGEAEIRPTLIAYENDRADCVNVKGDEKLVAVFNAAKNSFCQNALDIFTDCPGRERAGWLCDSYFTAKAELLFTGENKIEKSFLENIIIASTPEIPHGMIPKCFPSEHRGGVYIPNWSMWFVIELYDYYLRTGDKLLIEKAKGKVYDLISFFDKYVNEYGLLEDLESWVFIEWSVSNDGEYLKGVNFPSNMLFAYMLECVNKLYKDEKLMQRAGKMRQEILKLSFDGNFFADNAIRSDGKLVRCDTHVSETCQYYALFFGFDCGRDYSEKIKNEFGPLRKDAYPNVGKSNMFIGNYLRFFWLCDIGEYDRVLTEMTEYFYSMASKTGTLWEHDSPKASCNHGFASVAAVLILRCTSGYITTKNGQPVFENARKVSNCKLEVEFK